MASQAIATDTSPKRVKLVIDGRLYRLKKELALPADQLYFEYT